MNNVNAFLSALLIVISMFTMGWFTYQSGKEVQQQTIVNYCKADQAYLDNGLMLQCQVMESKMRDRT